MPSPLHWILSKGDKTVQKVLASELGINTLISQILINRNIRTPEEAKKFLFPSLKDLHNPFLMEDMERGVQRVIEAVDTNQNIVVYGDYDVDGITSTVILVKFLKEFHENTTYYIPDRIDEGYGLHQSAIDRLKKNGAQLIITVDCGISNHEEIAYAKRLGIDTIILDHHEVPETLPAAAAAINPNRKDSSFPFRNLAGVGVVFNFLVALRVNMRRRGFWRNKEYPNLKAYLDLVALGTIGDMMPLVDENRIFVKIGLSMLAEDNRTGLKALKLISGLENETVDSESAAFKLIPRINAAGRVGSSYDAVKLLLSNDMKESNTIAGRLDSCNSKRQELERTIINELLQKIDSEKELTGRNCFVFSSHKWHPGVIGIVASKIVERYYRPTVLISIKDGIGRGSARSIAEYNLFKGLESNCSQLLLSFGGHRYAAGISIREADIQDFSRILSDAIKSDMGEAKFVQQTLIDVMCRLEDIDYNLLSQIEMLAPFGNKNPEPVFCAENIWVESHTTVGNNHLRMSVSNRNIGYDSIWFNRGDLFGSLSGSKVGIAFTPQVNRWRGGSNIQLKIKDLSLMDS
ncbi:MAG: single-stranded-DNA-specific exonuclease RecJ [Syntrophales bacterium]|jgi:single-stranded-DNA-specific exonuclease|nr:single-stranded-DNA-specific exonuclease RecJ [Syntrophales bacterium]MDY0045178.1 single-stranded-DNA-specific exonuclease RecJ [Syntrophales bacterium]